MYVQCLRPLTNYRIAGNIGGEKTLAVWRCKLKIVNIKSVKLKNTVQNHMRSSAC